MSHAAWLFLPGAFFFLWAAADLDALRFSWVAAAYLVLSIVLVHRGVLDDRIGRPAGKKLAFADHYVVLLGFVCYLNFVGPAALHLMRTMINA